MPQAAELQAVPAITLAELIEYTDRKWHDWLRQNGDDVLKISAGPHGEARVSSFSRAPSRSTSTTSCSVR
jgi:hypothetical protein